MISGHFQTQRLSGHFQTHVYGFGGWDKGTWGLGVGLGDYPLGFGGWHKGNMYLFSNFQDSSTHRPLWWQITYRSVIQLSTDPAFRSNPLLVFWRHTSLAFWSDPLTFFLGGHWKWNFIRFFVSLDGCMVVCLPVVFNFWMVEWSVLLLVFS